MTPTLPDGAPDPPPYVTVLDEQGLAATIGRMAGEIAVDHPDGIVLVGVLKGAAIFVADLARAIAEVPVTVDFVSITRYAPDSGRVRILHDVTTDLSGRDVLLVEDLVDTGLTLGYLVRHLEQFGPRSVDVCALLDRPARRIVPLPLRYVGVEVADRYLLGYGLHAHDRFRNLPRVVSVARADLERDPQGYADALYGAPRASGRRR